MTLVDGFAPPFPLQAMLIVGKPTTGVDPAVFF